MTLVFFDCSDEATHTHTRECVQLFVLQMLNFILVYRKALQEELTGQTRKLPLEVTWHWNRELLKVKLIDATNYYESPHSHPRW